MLLFCVFVVSRDAIAASCIYTTFALSTYERSLAICFVVVVERDVSRINVVVYIGMSFMDYVMLLRIWGV